MRNKILNCENFVFHNVTLWFSHHALSNVYFYFSAARAYQKPMLIAFGPFFLKTTCFCENNRKVEFLKISSPRAEDRAKSKA